MDLMYNKGDIVIGIYGNQLQVYQIRRFEPCEFNQKRIKGYYEILKLEGAWKNVVYNANGESFFQEKVYV